MSECKFKRKDRQQEEEKQGINWSVQQSGRWSIWVLGLGSLIWLLLRSGAKPRRLAYPCPRAALLNSLGFVGYLLSLVGSTYFYRRLRHGASVPNLILFVLAITIEGLPRVKGT